MVLITVNVPQEIKERLQLEPNQSKLITELLQEYFLEGDDFKERMKSLEEKKQLALNRFEKEKERLKRKYELITAEKKAERELTQKKEERDKLIKINRKQSLLDLYDISEEELDKILEEFDKNPELFENNPFKILDAKGVRYKWEEK